MVEPQAVQCEPFMARADGMIRGPGLVDLQVNGYAGVDFNAPPGELTPERLRHAMTAMRRRGVAAAVPTLITDDAGAMLARTSRLAELLLTEPDLGAFYTGLHLEGPFISAEDGPRGAHPRAHAVAPADAPGLLERFIEVARGRLRIVTLAPELPGAMESIRGLSGRGILAALGHTAATSAQLADAVSSGARMSTHLGNGSHLMLPRLDNYVQFQLAQDALAASFIADGVHMPFFTLRNFLRAKTWRRSVLVTDAVAAADAPPGRYRMGDIDIVSDARVARLAGAQTLAGSCLTLDRAVVNAYRHGGCSPAQAWAMASTTPAELLGMTALPTLRATITQTGLEAVEWITPR